MQGQEESDYQHFQEQPWSLTALRIIMTVAHLSRPIDLQFCSLSTSQKTANYI